MVAAIFITCTQSFSNNKHKGNCGEGGGGVGGWGAIRARAASICTCETKHSLPQGFLRGNREDITQGEENNSNLV